MLRSQLISPLRLRNGSLETLALKMLQPAPHRATSHRMILLTWQWHTLALLLICTATISDQVKMNSRIQNGLETPVFMDENQTVVIGPPGGTATLDCRVHFLQDYTVSWVHRQASGGSGTLDGGSLDLLTIGNSTYTLESRIASVYRYPSNWALRITDLKPADAGTYLCQVSTFPPQVRVVYLEIHGPMIEIIREQMVYIAGSNLEVGCIYKNATTVPRKNTIQSYGMPKVNEHVQRLLEATRLLHAPELPEDTIVWHHNGERFSHRNRRRVKTIRKSDHVLSVLSIKSAIVDDSGNYSCILPMANLSDTIRLVIVDGEHSAAIYKNSETPAEITGSSLSSTSTALTLAPSTLCLVSLTVYLSSQITKSRAEVRWKRCSL